MIQNHDIENLPRSTPYDGTPPSRNNFVAEAIAQRWYEMNQLTELELAIPDAGPYRGSFASKRCDRSLYYGLAGTKASDPAGLADAWRMGLGTTVHEMLQKIGTELFTDDPDFTDIDTEVDVDLRPAGIPGSAHVDMVFTYKGKRTVVEIKSTGGFKFKMAATTFKGPPEGPSFGHIMQAALAAKALGAENVVVAYLAMENVSPSLAKAYTDSEAGRFAAEWHYTVEELEPWISAEVERINRVLDAVNDPEVAPIPRLLVDPEYPTGARVNDPQHGLWVVTENPESRAIIDTGDTWMCAYCDHQAQCITDGA